MSISNIDTVNHNACIIVRPVSFVLKRPSNYFVFRVPPRRIKWVRFLEKIRLFNTARIPSRHISMGICFGTSKLPDVKASTLQQEMQVPINRYVVS